MNEKIVVDIDKGVAQLTLNRAIIHNAFDDSVIAELTDIIDNLAQRDDVKVVVLAANGKSFSAGADASWMQRMAKYTREQNVSDAKALATMLDKLNNLPQPTIAKVQGSAFGGGVGLVACCDIAIASNAAKFCLSEVKLGLIPATIGPYVVQAIGPRAARRYFVSAEIFSANTALQLGLVSELVAADALDAACQKVIDQLLTNGPSAMRRAKLLVRHLSYREVGAETIDYTSQQIADVRVSAEGQEGLQAFLAKRKPDWV
jgi:methylglutaconyl-CoA hydratase